MDYFEKVKSLKELANRMNKVHNNEVNLEKHWKNNTVFDQMNELRDIVEKPHFK